MNRNQISHVALALAVASVVLSIMFKTLFLVLLIPAALFWNKGREDKK